MSSIPRQNRKAAEDFNYYYKKWEKYPPLSRKLSKFYLNIIHGKSDTNPETGEEVSPAPEIQQSYYQHFWSHNMRFVMHLVKNKYGFKWNDPLTMPLISAGSIGLGIAIKKFDISRTNTFTTYAEWWIMSYIKSTHRAFIREVNPRKTKLGRDFIKQKKMIHRMLGEKPSEDFIFSSFQWPKSHIQEYLQGFDCIKNFRLDYLDNTEAGDPSSNIKDLGCDFLFWVRQPGDPKDELINQEAIKSLEQAFSALTSTEAYVLIKIYGLFCESTMTRVELSEKLKKKTAEIKKIETNAYMKLWSILEDWEDFI